jgi:4-alpha-glucanotransferase
MDAPSTARKAHAEEMHEKNWQQFGHFQTAMARAERYEEEAPHKAGLGANRPVCSAELSGCASSWLLPTLARR